MEAAEIVFQVSCKGLMLPKYLVGCGKYGPVSDSATSCLEDKILVQSRLRYEFMLDEIDQIPIACQY